MLSKCSVRYFILLIVFSIGCNQEETVVEIIDPDFINLIDQYVGEYNVTETFESYGFQGGCPDPIYSQKDTIITITSGNSDTTIIVLGREVSINSLGRYSDYHYDLYIENEVYEGYKN
jgi:hypothetical protein